MKVIRKHALTGKFNEMELNITHAQYEELEKPK